MPARLGQLTCGIGSIGCAAPPGGQRQESAPSGEGERGRRFRATAARHAEPVSAAAAHQAIEKGQPESA